MFDPAPRRRDPKNGVKSLLDVDDATADRLIEGAKLLGLVDDDDSVVDIASLIRTASLVERRGLLRFYLERFRPYAEWKRRVAQGFDPLEAARQVKAVFGIEESAAAARDWFLDLGQHCGSLTEEGSTVIPVQGEAPSLGSLVSSVLSSQESTAQVLSDYVGQQLWAKLPGTVREHLVSSLAKLVNAESPDEAVREAGLAMDKYMSDLGQAMTSNNYTGLTMGQSASQLRTDGLLVEKQEGFTGYGVKLRNAAEHPDTDQDLAGGRWVVTSKGASTYLRAVLDFMRSANAKLEGRYEI